MEITYEILKSETSLELSYGCFTKCNVNTNYGNDTWCGLNNCRKEQNIIASTKKNG